MFGGFENVLHDVDIRAIPVYRRYDNYTDATLKEFIQQTLNYSQTASQTYFFPFFSPIPPPPFSTPSFPPQSSPVLVGFEQAEYQTSEGSVELCFSTSGIIPKPFTVNLTTSDITAIGTYTLYVYSMGVGGGGRDGDILSNSWSVPGPFS